MNQLSVGDIISNGISIGLKNLAAVFVNGLLWILTIWIPYLNVGTTIGMVTLVAKMGRDEGLSMTEIFNPEYRKYMGEFFLLVGFMTMGIYAALIFMIVPAYVLYFAWMLAPLLLVDKGLDPIAAIKKSNQLTYGKKWTIFFGTLVLTIIVYAAVAILFYIGQAISPILGLLLVLIAIAAAGPILMGGQAYIYKNLTEGQA